ncbi:MAG: hypothetical protein ABFR33_03915 [Verrucomicrobiota bacterium]
MMVRQNKTRIGKVCAVALLVGANAAFAAQATLYASDDSTVFGDGPGTNRLLSSNGDGVHSAGCGDGLLNDFVWELTLDTSMPNVVADVAWVGGDKLSNLSRCGAGFHHTQQLFRHPSWSRRSPSKPRRYRDEQSFLQPTLGGERSYFAE